MSAQFSIKDLPEHGLHIVGPMSPTYDNMVAALSQGNPDTTVITAMRPYSVFVKNTNRQNVVACLLKWELMTADGKTDTETSGFIATWRLMNQGASGEGGFLIAPYSTWFFPPSNIEVFQGKGNARPAPSDSVSESIEADHLKELTSRFDQYVNITVLLDGAFFEDGTFVGPDTTNFFAQVETLRNARRDLYSELEYALEQGKPASEAFNEVEKIAGRLEVPIDATSTSVDLYSQTKKSVAQEILRMREKAGDQKTLEWVMRPLRTLPVELKRR